MRGETKVLCVSDEDTYEAEFPCRALLVAVLDRAYRDLGLQGYIEKHYRRKAIAWFTDDKEYKTNYITFKQCIQVLELGAFELQYLKKKVALARRQDEEDKARLQSYRAKEQTEGEGQGIRACELI